MSETEQFVSLPVSEFEALMADLKRLRNERDDLYENNWPWEWVIAGREKERRQKAEADNERLRERLNRVRLIAQSTVGRTSDDERALSRIERLAASPGEQG